MSDDVAARYTQLQKSLSRNSAVAHRLRCWSRFIRARDDYRCVLCESRNGLAAHHVIRRSFWERLQFQAGNGVTLCRRCHGKVHSGFNRRPRLNLPMDAEGGEKIDLLTGIFGVLVDDAYRRSVPLSPYYDFDDDALAAFRRFQGLDANLNFMGAPIEQAYQIWS